MIDFLLLSEDRLQETITFFTKEFLKEPINNILKVNESELYPISKKFCEISMEHGLGVIAVNRENNKVVGVILSMDSKMEIVLPGISIKFKIIFTFLEKLNNKFFPDAQIIYENDCLHLFTVVVDEKFYGTGIATNLFKLTQDIAKKNRFRFIIVEATGKGSSKICEKHNFINLGYIEYKNFELENSFPLINIQAADRCNLYLKTL